MIKMRAYFLLILIIITQQQSSGFLTFKKKMETDVIDLANSMKSAYARRCESSMKQCTTKSFNLCYGTSQKICIEDHPKPGECLAGGAFMSKTSTIRFPNSVDPESLSDEQKQFVCTSTLLQDKFQELNTDRKFQHALAYVGTTLGSFRSFPSSRRIDEDTQQCPDYDPRFRPWYVVATSGAKNVILIIDTSGSMDGERIKLAKAAAKSVLSTLSNNDFVGLIIFNSEAKSLYSNRILRATDQVKDALKAEVDDLTVAGQTNYQIAFRKAFNILNAATTDEFGAPCSNAENVFLFLTDGQPTAGEESDVGLKSIIDGLNTEHDIKLFTYGLGSGISPTLLKFLACEYKGIMFQISDSSERTQLATVMRGYYTYISEGIQISDPIWTEPYEDAFGFGRMVTVSMPIYYEENGIRQILGVAGIDVVMQTFTDFGIKEQSDVVKQLIKNVPCHESTLSECDIEKLRPNNSICNISNCSSSSALIATCVYTTQSILQAPVDEGVYKCCGLSIGAFVGIIVAIVVILIVVIVVVWVKRKRQQQQRQQQQRQQYRDRDQVPNSNEKMRGLNPEPFFFNRGN